MELLASIESAINKTTTSPLYTIQNPLALEIKSSLDILADKVNTPLRLAIIGEVKSGKSTLLNCFAGGEISPTNVSEATASIMKISYSSSESAIINFLDGTCKNGSVSEIFDELIKFQNNQEYFKNCKDVVVKRNMPGLKSLNIIDTPGLGTITQQNEERTIEYFQDVDVVLWVFNGNYLGQTDVNNYVRTVSNMGKPIIAVINRIDEVDGDPQDLVDYLDDTMGVYFKRVFPISAKKAYHGIVNNDSIEIDSSGFKTLYDYLQNNIEKQSEVVQTESILNSVQVLQNQLSLIHRQILDNINLKLELFEQLGAKIDYASSTFKSDINSYISNWAYNEFLVNVESSLKNKVNSMGMTSTNSIEKAVKDELDKIISNGDNREIKEFIDRLNIYINKSWQSALERIDEELEESMSLSIEDNFKTYTELPSLYSAAGESSGLQDSMMTAVAAGGALSVYAAVLGPAAAHVSLAGALGAFMPPLMLAGAAVGVLKIFTENKKKKDSLNSLISSSILAMREAVCNKIKDNVSPFILDIREKTLNEAKEKFIGNNFDGMSTDEIYKLKANVELFLTQ